MYNLCCEGHLSIFQGEHRCSPLAYIIEIYIYILKDDTGYIINLKLILLILNMLLRKKLTSNGLV